MLPHLNEGNSAIHEEYAMPTRLLVLAGMLLTIELLAGPARAQVTQADLRGTVADESGAVLPGVTVTATHVDTGAVRTITTSSTGVFILRALPVDLTAEFVGTSSGDVVVATACLDVSRLPFQPATEGHEAAAFDLVGVVVDEEGKAVSQFSDRVALSLTPELKERALRNGLTYRKTLAVRPGLLQARVAVRADGSGLLGSAAQWVEVPDRARPGLALSSVLLLAEGHDAAPAPPAARGTVSFDRLRLPEVSRREGRETRYRLTPEPLEEAVSWIASVGGQWDERLARLERHVERRRG